jgi:cell division protein FtsW (lipid II flippase)
MGKKSNSTKAKQDFFSQFSFGNKPPAWEGSPAARYLILIAITILVGISLIMAFSASSNDAVIRQVQRDFAAQAQEVLTPEESIELELDYYAALDAAMEEAGTTSGQEEDGIADSRGFFSFLTGIFGSAYAAGFRHLLFALVGAFLAIGIARVDYRKMVPYAIPLAWTLLGMLAFLAIAGRPVLGSARWIDFGLFSFQPSEFAKPILLILIAAYCSWAKDADDKSSERQKKQSSLPVYRRDWVMPATLIGGSLLAIFLSPDIGTVLIIGVGLFAAYVLAGWPWGRLVAGLAALGVLFMGRILLMGGGYQQRRIFEFVTRWTEGVASHQTWQAELALGSGGILGLGPGLSRQKFRYLPEAHNDFIIAILGEELGLIGVFLVLIAFVFILWGGLHIASRAQDRFGMALAGGATVLLIFQALLNIFAVISLGPVTGKPLPFVTLGGSSMISTFILIGLIFSVARFGNLKPPRVAFASIIKGPVSQLAVLESNSEFATRRAVKDDDLDAESDAFWAGSSGRLVRSRDDSHGGDDGGKHDNQNAENSGTSEPRLSLRPDKRKRITEVTRQTGQRRQTQDESLADQDASRGDDSIKRRERPKKRREEPKGRPREVEHDEDDLEWRWDSGTHLPGSRSRR